MRVCIVWCRRADRLLLRWGVRESDPPRDPPEARTPMLADRPPRVEEITGPITGTAVVVAVVMLLPFRFQRPEVNRGTSYTIQRKYKYMYADFY